MRIVYILCLIFALPISAQNNNNINVHQYVFNSFTKHGIPDAFVTVMKEDSTIIDTIRTKGASGSHNAYAWFLKMERKTQSIIVKIEHPEYGSHIGTYDVINYGRNRSHELPEVFLRRKDKKQYKDLEHMLDEVEVVATKVKVVYKNDTIIYNADAFNVPDGSMLDRLIRQFPGAELKDNGEIYINGKKVDYLTLNGKDFMKGNNKVMLENLPYYTVEKVRVFNESTERSKLLGQDVEKKDYVMDVQLKKEYRIGYMGNMLLGGGTQDRRNSRLFLTRFTDNSRILLMGNANNVNENMSVDYGGNFRNGAQPDGILTTKKILFNVYVDDKNNRFREEGTIVVRAPKHTTENRIARQTFLENGDIYSRMQTADENKEMKFEGINVLTLERLGLRAKTNVSFSKQEGNGTSREASFNSDPNSFGSTVAVLDSMFSSTLRPELVSINTNRISNRSLSEGEKFQIDNTLSWDKSLKTGDNIGIEAYGLYKDNKDKAFNRYSLDYPHGNGMADLQNKYSSDRLNSYLYKAGAHYSIHFLNMWNLGLSYSFSQSYESHNLNRHRLDWLGDEWGLGSSIDNFGMLPSAHADMLTSLDPQNSYSNGYMKRVHNAATSMSYNAYSTERGTYTFFRWSVPFENVSERNHYVRNTLNTVVRNNTWLIRPSIALEHQFDEWRNKLTINYNCTMTPPNIMQMVDVRDTSDPLAVRLGNPDLKTAVIHAFDAMFYRRFRKTENHLTVRVEANIMSNLVANGFTYDRTTGVYTYRPENVNGNWNANAGLNYRGNLDKAKRLYFETNTRYNYYRNVDLASEPGSETSRRSKVDNHILSEAIRMNYNFGKLRVGVLGSVNWNMSKGRAHLYSTDLNAVDYAYGLTGQYEFPFKMQVSTNLTVNSRRGYDEPSMNTDDIVWNASLSRSFLKDKLGLRIEAFDILHQLSQTAYVVNGQGRTETWRRTLPNYVMLNLTWKFNVNPQKK